MKEMKRILSLVLCFVMVVGLLPMSAVALELNTDTTDPGYSTTVEKKYPVVSDDPTEPTYSSPDEEKEPATKTPVIEDNIIAEMTDILAVENGSVVDAAIVFSDLHTSSSNDKKSTLTGVMTAFKNAGLPVSSVTSAGDAFSMNSSTYTAYTDPLTGYIQSVFPGVSVNYTWSDHDRAAMNNSTDKVLLSKQSRLVYGAGEDGTYGTADDGNYYVYLLSMGDLASNDRYSAGFNYTATNISGRVSAGFTQTVTKAIENFLADTADLDQTKPLIIVGHQPLFDRRGDNAWAEDWVAAINEVAADMDVVYFFGHNHKYDVAADYYYAKGSYMPVPNRADWNWKYNTGFQSTVDMSTTDVKLNFTHACAGYLAPSSTGSTSSTTREGTAMAVVIYDNAFTLTTYNANGKYTSSYALDVTVERDHAAAPTLEKLSISGKTEYVEGDELALTVTATYSNGTTADVTDDTVFTGHNMSKAGTYVVTAAYGDKIATASITVAPPTITEWDSTELISVQATASGLTGMTVTSVYGNPDLSYLLADYISVDVQLEGVAAGAQVEYSMLVFDEIPTDGIVLYHIAEDGTETAIPFTMTTSASGGTYLEFTTALTGIFAYGLPAIPEGYALTKLEVTNVVKTEYVAGDSLDMVNPIVTATYTKAGAEDIVRVISIYNEETTPNGYTVSGYNMAEPGDQTVTISYGGLTTSFAIKVWPKDFSSNGVSVSVGTGDVGAKEVTAVESQNPYVDSVLAGILDTDTMVAYDISLLFNDGYSISNTEKIVTLPVPAGVTNPAVYYVSNNGQTVEQMTVVNTVGNTVSFVTTHFSTYAIGDEAEPDSNTVTIGGTSYVEKEVYVPVTKLTDNGKYLIVNTSKNQALINNNGTDGSTGVTVVTGSVTVGSATYSEYIENPASTAIWTAKTSGNAFTLSNSGEYLRPRNSSDMVSGTSGTWTYNASEKTLSGTYYYQSYYVRWTGSAWENSTTKSSVLLYQAVTAKIPVSSEVNYTMQADNLSVILDDQKTVTGQLNYALLANGEAPSSLPTDGTYSFTETTDSNDIIASIGDNGLVTFNGIAGTAKVKVAYTWTQDGESYTVYQNVIVEAKAPYYTIELHEKNENGDLVLIEAPIAKKGVVAGQAMSVWAVVKQYSAQHPNGNDVGALGTALNWSVSDEEIATINSETGLITFTGEKFGTFRVTVSYVAPNGETITDTITISASESKFVVPGDGTDDFPTYPNEGAVRFDKTATAVGNFSETGIAKIELSMTGVPYTTHNRMDVVLMLDRSSSMQKVSSRIPATIAATKAFVKNIVMNEDGTFNNNRILVLDFLGGNLDSSEGGGSSHVFQINQYTESEEGGYQIIGSQTELDALFAKIDSGFVAQGSLYGTEYAQGLEACYNALSASRKDGNQQFCVFMSDGIPNYMMGETTHFKKTDDIAATFDVTNRTSSTGTASRNSTKYEYEYYSTQMKNEGVTVFSVGLGLQNTNSAWSGTSKEVCEQVASMLLNDISGPAGETADQRDTGNAVSKKDEYFFSVADSDAATQMENVFSSIAQKIREAATDVVVEDMVDNDFAVNFSLPQNVTSTMTDGLSEFYIQAVEYQLNADKERTGDPTILENFTFNADGTFKSHTVGGKACANCSHVTITNGKVTKINGTYFSYTSVVKTNEEGEEYTEEVLVWNAEKLTTTELALQYFAYLDHSAGFDPADQVDPGTYYTNEYATLTYTNYKNNRVQQNFPVPQVTWNGAQVSYVFYLVNAQGQPVNRAGRVVPFAEAVYVTDVFTFSVVWNDMEQSAGLSAAYLAEDLVPDVYSLYDNDAGYDIHVYEDQDKVNLNNHFVIRGNVEDAYNTKENWTNPKTTYVFNTKADAEKYNVVGAYIANDGDDANDATSYLCKDYAVTNTAYEQVTEGTTTYYKVTQATYSGSGEQWKPGTGDAYAGGSKLSDGCVYYVDDEGKVYTIVVKNDGEEVRKGFDFANTTVAFAVVWTPKLKEDTVVVDYGLDVVIDVTTNDALAAGVVGVRADAPAGVVMNSGSYTAGKAHSVDVYIDANNDTNGLKELKIGTATVESLTSIRFSLDKENGMNFADAAVFYYESAVNYYDINNKLVTTSMYSSVTVIPATTVYYEDDFVTFASYTKDGEDWSSDEKSQWVTSAQSGTQQQDRPGASQISEALDADNNYGHDKAYANMSQFSMGSAAKITVDANTYGTATFTFCGTGFDVISLTSNKTGTLMVAVQNDKGELVKNDIVDTYYGYSQNEEGDWVVTTDDAALYQVPVIKYFGMDYGTYTVTITAAYNQFFDHDTTDSSYELYLDAIRVYDPTGNNNDVANKAYKADGEYMPSYFELRDWIIDANEGFNILTGDDAATGIVFIDGGIKKPTIADYTNYGPNNELYLAYGQSIAFDLSVAAKDGYDTVVRIGLKSVGGTAAVAGLWNAENSKKVDEMTVTLNTATDMYYDISALPGGTVVITNTGKDSILSITNIKVSFRPTTADAASLAETEEFEAPDVVFTVTRQTLEQAVETIPVHVSFVPGKLEAVAGPINPMRPQKPVLPVKPVLPELPVKPIQPIRPVKKNAVTVSFEETVVRNRRVLG